MWTSLLQNLLVQGTWTVYLNRWHVLVVLPGAVGASTLCLSVPVKATKAKKAVNGNKKQAVAVEEDDDDDDEDDSDEEESEEEEAAPVKAKQAVKAKKAPAMEVEEDDDDEEDSDDDDDEEDSDDDDEEEEDDEEAEVTQKKRKATGADMPAKKAKIDAGVCMVTWFTTFGCAAFVQICCDMFWK